MCDYCRLFVSDVEFFFLAILKDFEFVLLLRGTANGELKFLKMIQNASFEAYWPLERL